MEVHHLLLGLAWHIARKVAGVGGGVEVEPRGTGKLVGHNAEAGGTAIQAPVVLLAVARVLEEAFLLALEVRAGIRCGWWRRRCRRTSTNV